MLPKVAASTHAIRTEQAREQIIFTHKTVKNIHKKPPFDHLLIGAECPKIR